MWYLSAILDTRVKDSSGVTLGRVSDVLIRFTPNDPSQLSPIIGILVRPLNKKKELFFVPNNTIATWDDGGPRLRRVQKDFTTPIPTTKDIIHLRASVLDKQIVDLAGHRVVRVNDLQIADVAGTLSVISIDVSTTALVRRLGIPSTMLGGQNSAHLLAWGNVQMIGEQVRLATGIAELNKLHPADIANIIEQMNINHGSDILQSLDKDIGARPYR